MDDDDAKPDMEDDDAKQERQKERTCRETCPGLLQKNESIFDGADAESNEDQEEEREQLERAFSAKRSSLMVGLAAGLMVFGALRTGPKVLTH
jgi:hypothetical protein